MGFTLVALALLRVAVPADAPRCELFENLGYPVGFLIVILGRQQLFTENTVTAILPLLDSANRLQTLGRVVRLWGIVLATNLAGAALFAYAVLRTAVFTEPARAASGSSRSSITDRSLRSGRRPRKMGRAAGDNRTRTG